MPIQRTAIVVNLEHQSRTLTRVNVRLDRYLLRWLEEQFIDSCPKELANHLRERAPERLVQIAKIADQYLEAHGKHLFSSASKKPQVQPKVEETKTAQSDTTALQ